jgi:3-hydroxyisobutyrate dehydrogenase-like beta-hydroxyacid dehydrogenase
MIGLGLMGSAMSRRLIATGHSVLGFDIDPDKGAALGRIGGRAASSIAEVARGANPIILSVFNTEQTEDVVENGILPALRPGSGKIVLATSTCDPDRIEALSARVAAHGIHLLDAPISGSSEGVGVGDATVLVGGDEGSADEVAPLLDRMFSVRIYMGRAGNGGRAKLAINLIGGLHRLVLAEGLVFAEKMGLDPKDFLAVARQAASYSRAMDTKGVKMVNGDFAPLGRVRQHLKDVQLMLAQAKKLGQELPLASMHQEVLEACIRHGEADMDNSIVINEIRRRTTGAT